MLWTDQGYVSVLRGLQTAFCREQNTRLRYVAFAQQAQVERLEAIASLFDAIAQAETIHANNHAGVIIKLGAEPSFTPQAPHVRLTRENLAAAAQSELADCDRFYPLLIARANAARAPEALRSFILAAMAEACHARLFSDLLCNLEATQTPHAEYFVCSICGNVFVPPSSRRCGICHNRNEWP